MLLVTRMWCLEALVSQKGQGMDKGYIWKHIENFCNSALFKSFIISLSLSQCLSIFTPFPKCSM